MSPFDKPDIEYFERQNRIRYATFEMQSFEPPDDLCCAMLIAMFINGLVFKRLEVQASLRDSAA